MIVVDTDVMVHLVTGGERGEVAGLLLRDDPEWAAPSILPSELANVLVGMVRRRWITEGDARGMLADAGEVLADRVARVPGREVVAAALECDLSAYDAEFVVLARRLGVPLVSADRAILEGASDVAVPLPEK